MIHAKGRKRLLIALLAIIVLAIAGAAYALVTARSGPTADTADMLSDERFVVQRLSEARTVEASGNIEAFESEIYRFPANGEIVQIDVREGQAVVSGQQLARQEDQSLRYELAQIEYSISQKEGSASPREMELLNMQRDMKIDELEDIVLRSKMQGVVSSIYLEEADSAGPSTDVMRVIDVSRMKASVAIDEIDIPLIGEGQRVDFIFDAYPQLRYQGFVSDIPLEARVTSNGIAVIDVELILENPDEALKPGFTFTAEIFVSEAEDVLVVSKNGILSQGGDMGIALLAPAEGDAPRPTRVEISEYDSDTYRILSGLEAGAVLVSPRSLMNEDGGFAGAGFLMPGMGGGLRDGGQRPAGAAPPGGAVPPGTAAGGGSGSTSGGTRAPGGN